MNDTQFQRQLLKEIVDQSNYALPWPPRSAHDRVQYLAFAGRYLCPEYVFKWPQIDWFENRAILDFYNDYPCERTCFNMDRRWNVLQLLRLIAAVPGATAECGVFQGQTSLLVLRHAPEGPQGKRVHYMFDSFEGLSAPGEYDHADHFHCGDLSCGEDYVRQKLAAYEDRAVYFKGWIPSRFNEVEDAIFAFVHIDVDLYAPTRDSIGFFYPRIPDGGILVCDDYGCSTCPGATKAVNDFLADKKEKMLAFASGGGFFIKGVQTDRGA